MSSWLPLIITFAPLAILVLMPKREDEDVEMSDDDRSRYGYDDGDGDEGEYEVTKKPRVVREVALRPRSTTAKRTRRK